MVEKEAEERFVKSYPEFCYNGKPLSPYWDLWQDGAEFGYNKANEWHKLDWHEDFPDIDKLVRVRTKYGEEYICETYSYRPTEDEIGYGSVITQFTELNGDWVDDNEIEYWGYIEPFKETKENDR